MQARTTSLIHQQIVFIRPAFQPFAQRQHPTGITHVIDVYTAISGSCMHYAPQRISDIIPYGSADRDLS